MKTKLLLIALFAFIFNVKSQNLIAVQNGNTPSFYEDANEAFDNAVEGDTLYFPGGSFNINRTIDKTLHIIGTGHNPNSTTATGATIFAIETANTPQLTYVNNGGGSITGIAFTTASAILGNININADIESLLIDRVYIPNKIITVEGTIKSLLLIRSIISQFTIRKNHVSGVSPSGTIANCIIYGNRNYADNLLIENNDFVNHTSSRINVTRIFARNCNIVNNIFQLNSNYILTRDSSNSSFRNNHGMSINGIANTNYGSANINSYNIGPEIFVNYTSSTSLLTYDFDVQLVDGSPLLTAANNGGQIGVYGGRFPWKEDSVPFNPHIVSKNISGSTDENGNLPIQIEVQAQDN